MSSMISSLADGVSGIQTLVGNTNAKNDTEGYINDNSTNYSDAQNYLNTYYNQASNYYQPYANNAGYNNAYYQSAILGTPQTYTDNNGQQQSVTANYQDNPTSKYQIAAYNNTMANRGLLGSGQAAYGRSKIASDNYSTWLSNLSNLISNNQYGTTGLANTATNRSNQYSNNANNYMKTQSGLYTTAADYEASKGEDVAKYNSSSGQKMGNAFSSSSYLSK